MPELQLSPIENRVGCINAAMLVIGQKWTALILRDLSSGPKRFRDFTETTPSLLPRTLSARLEYLKDQGVVCECSDGGYELTEKGQALIPVLRAMADWGDAWAVGKKVT